MASLFEAPLDPGAREYRFGTSFRFIKRGSGAFTIDANDGIDISIVLSEGADLRLRRQGRTTRISTRVMEHGVMVPGHPVHVTITGEICALQMRLALTDLYRSAEEDHGLDPAHVDVPPKIASNDDGLMRHVWAGFGSDPIASETATREVATYLLQSASVRGLQADRTLGGLSPTRLKRVLELVEDSFQEELTLNRMAAAAALSPFHFAREFRHSVGCSPHEYLLRRRLARATILLSNPRMKIADIANRTGFAHASHLGRNMRRQYGFACSELRALMADNPPRASR